MSISFRYWDDCVDPQDMEAMWKEPEVCTEWLDAGETTGQRVHLSRDPDGQPYLTQTEIKAVADIIVRRHFDMRIDPEMICAIAELESGRQPLCKQYDRKSKETTLGIMQVLQKMAEWLFSELGYRSYEVEGNPDLLYRPFVNVYFGAAYLKWLSNFEQIERTEEFVVRAFKGGTKKATHKSTLSYWKRYSSVKESLPSRKHLDGGPSLNEAAGSAAPALTDAAGSAAPALTDTGAAYTYWDSRASPEDMEELRGGVGSCGGRQNLTILLRWHPQHIAEIILSKYFSSREIKPTVLCALAEIVSMRFLNGVEPRIGVMGIDYPTAFWLYTELGYRAYRVDSVDDLTKPFESMYFGVAYLSWLYEYEGRERDPQFVVQAYLGGPKNVNVLETGPLWLKFEESLSFYEGTKRDQASCTIL
ncbi:SLT domain-containing protein [Cephalotus follicularis]|uniref:SLT domain-containing protein n=1 Tax=Cephalotus follicularis TaxID=3775 RepID=A0A1Q3CWW8_CEPFO|nr:SLT domain-containing protein [Cephalotus follicularis]